MNAEQAKALKELFEKQKVNQKSTDNKSYEEMMREQEETLKQLQEETDEQTQDQVQEIQPTE